MPNYNMLMTIEGFKAYMPKVIWYVSKNINSGRFRIHCIRLFLELKIITEEDFSIYSKLYLKKNFSEEEQSNLTRINTIIIKAINARLYKQFRY